MWGARADPFARYIRDLIPDERIKRSEILKTRALSPGDCVGLSSSFDVILVEGNVGFDEGVSDGDEFSGDCDERDFGGFALGSHIGVNRLEARVRSNG